jgi:hypothetical protein
MNRAGCGFTNFLFDARLPRVRIQLAPPAHNSKIPAVVVKTWTTSNEKSQILDRFIVVQQQNLLGRDLEAPTGRSQGVNRVPAENVLV